VTKKCNKADVGGQKHLTKKSKLKSLPQRKPILTDLQKNQIHIQNCC
jgi:hypothetical protein